MMHVLCLLKVQLLFLYLVEDQLLCIAEVFSSVSKLKTLPRLERRLLDRFDKFLQSTPDDGALDLLRRKIQHLQRENSESLHNPLLMECPLHAFRLVRRLVKEWSEIFKPAHNSTSSSSVQYSGFFSSAREWLNKQDYWPTDEDLSGAAMALVRLHRVYRLDYANLLTGHFLQKTSLPLTSLELADVTSAAVKMGLACEAEVLSALVNQLAPTDNDHDTAREEDMTTLPKVIKEYRPKCENDTVSIISSFDSKGSTLTEERRRRITKLHDHLCRKAVQTDIVYGSGTRCYLHTTSIPYLQYKAEMVNLDPLVVVFYDVINDDEIWEIKEHSLRKLSPSTLAVQQVIHERQLVRVSQTAWLFDVSPVLSRISRRVQLITRLSTRLLSEGTHAEPYQVVNYGIGGMNGLHEDSVRIPRARGQENAAVLQNSGDRTATWMYYLSDVSLGGATVFPLLGAGVRPLKGSAVFWYNVKRSGEGDVRMVHAGCPVLLGDKWVANKWLREAGNVFTRPCLLDPNL